MTVKLTGNFLATARCLIYQDGNAITWSFNPNTNQLTAAYTGAGSAGSHNPTATIGLTAVNGTATTWMTSDSAPALSQAIVPTWTALHTFSAGLTVSGGSTTISGHVLTLTATASVGGTNTGDQTLPTGANPSASVGLSAVNGSAATFLTSDSAPALSVAIVPTWTGLHTFNGKVVIGAPGTGLSLAITGLTNANIVSLTDGTVITQYQTGTGTCYWGTTTNHPFNIMTNNTARIAVSAAGGVVISNALGVNGSAAPAKVTGWGTPTGQTVVNNFAAGAGTSVLQMSEAIAQIITDLKAFGIYGA